MGKKILVVDDNPDAVTILSTMLEASGYTVVGEYSGASALAAANVDPPDLILLDLMMPEMSGMEVLQRLKDNPATARIPVILVTAKTQDEDVITGYRYGAEYYITKPFTAKQLRYGVNLVLGQGDSVE